MVVFFVVMVFAVTLVNGFTDAPNAIATAITSRALKPTSAIVMAGVCNFAGALVMALISPNVAKTVYYIVNFEGREEIALSALSAGMSAVVIFALVAFLFGIPTSESHALMAGITGAALAGRMSPRTVDLYHWGLVLLGLLFSTLPAFLTSKLISRLLTSLCSGVDRRRAIGYFMKAQRVSAAWSAFMHGAQDSQKFIGVLMLGLSISSGDEGFKIPLWLSLLSASVMTLGTLLGGTRIIKKVGESMTRLDACGGTAADLASSLVLTLCSFLGLPVSTTHSKTSAIMGAGSGRGLHRGIVRQIILAWALTFPACGAIGFLLGLIFYR